MKFEFACPGQPAFFAGVVLALSAFICPISLAQAPQLPAGSPFQPAEQFYKNIQVLKGTPADQMLPTMIAISESLGVKCPFCHTTENFAKDPTSLKDRTRQMLRMTASINQRNFAGARVVTCFTCHQGSTHTVDIPFVGTRRPETGVIKPGAGPLPTIDQILGRYLNALGGASVVHHITTLVLKGTAKDIGGLRFPFEFYAETPDKRLLIRHRPERDMPIGYNGSRGWIIDVAGDARPMRSEEIDEYKLEDIVYFPTRIRPMLRDLHVEGVQSIDGREVYTVSGKTTALPLVRLYFDKKSGILARINYHIDSQVGRYPVQVDYADYRDNAGLLIPFRWTFSQVNVEGGSIVYQVEKAEANVPLKESTFVRSDGASRPK